MRNTAGLNREYLYRSFRHSLELPVSLKSRPIRKNAIRKRQAQISLPPATCFTFSSLWIRSQYDYPKRRWISTGVHGFKFQITFKFQSFTILSPIIINCSDYANCWPAASPVPRSPNRMASFRLIIRFSISWAAFSHSQRVILLASAMPVWFLHFVSDLKNHTSAASVFLTWHALRAQVSLSYITTGFPFLHNALS